MKINLCIDTSDMTKEERLDVQKQLETDLNQLKSEIRDMAEAECMHSDTAEPSTFFGITFDFENMTGYELCFVKECTQNLITSLLSQLKPKICKNNVQTSFFEKIFCLSSMSKKELLLRKAEATNLLFNVTHRLALLK